MVPGSWARAAVRGEYMDRAAPSERRAGSATMFLALLWTVADEGAPVMVSSWMPDVPLLE